MKSNQTRNDLVLLNPVGRNKNSQDPARRGQSIRRITLAEQHQPHQVESASNQTTATTISSASAISVNILPANRATSYQFSAIRDETGGRGSRSATHRQVGGQPSPNQTLYEISIHPQQKSTKRYCSAKMERAAYDLLRCRQSALGGLPKASLFIGLVACILVSHISLAQLARQETSPVSQTSSQSSHSSKIAQDDKESSQISARAEQALSGTSEQSANKQSADSSAITSAESSQKSIVASLSSAVASAAAAAAVAAAKSGLSGGDARSLLTGAAASLSGVNSAGNPNQASPGVRLAYRIADAIPEVPYNILHNMKKLDHAAPFYNVPNKIGGSSGVRKESAPNLLATVLAARGGPLESLSSLFRSPIWKRIADGYGDFASEFRSLFRAPARPMKGSTSSTTKLLRDISVPALLMLIATTMPNDWRPVRTRRKSILPSLPHPLHLSSGQPGASMFDASMLGSASSVAPAVDGPNYSAAPMYPAQLPNGFNFNGDTNYAMESQMQPARFTPTAGQFARTGNTGDINLGAPDTFATNWNQVPQIQQQQQQPQQQQQVQQPQPMRRIGDSSTGGMSGDANIRLQNTKPVTSSTGSGDRSSLSPSVAVSSLRTPASLFSSLTSSLASVGQGKLLGRIMNVNGNDNHAQGAFSNRIMSNLAGGQDSLRLDEKSRYSLVGPDEVASGDHSAQNSVAAKPSSVSEQVGAKLSPSSKPFLLSAMTGVLNSMFNSPPESGSSLAPTLYSSAQNFLLREQPLRPTEGPQNHFRQQLQLGLPEQRDLSQILPQSWVDVVKRKVNTVQNQASSQWKSIEGQLTNWVQDKLKSAPITPAGSIPVQSPSVAASNLIASVSSTAMNILGIGNKKAATTAIQSPVASDSSPLTSSSATTPAKTSDSTNRNSQTASASALSPKAKLVEIIVNTLTNRQASAASTSAPSSSKPSSADESPARQYPTVTSAPSPSAASSSMTAGTSSSMAVAPTAT